LSLHYLSSTHPPPTHTYTLSLHDALPISAHGPQFPGHVPADVLGPTEPRHRSPDLVRPQFRPRTVRERLPRRRTDQRQGGLMVRSEEHTSELQSRGHLVCRLLLEKKKK